MTKNMDDLKALKARLGKKVAKKTGKKTKAIDPSLLEHIALLVDVASHLPILVYEAVEDYTVRELVVFAKEHDLDVAKARRPGKQASKGQTEATATLDDKVFRIVKSIGRKRKDKRVVMRDLVDKLSNYSDQQIRRALVRLTKREQIQSEGSTKDKSYRIAA